MTGQNLTADDSCTDLEIADHVERISGFDGVKSASADGATVEVETTAIADAVGNVIAYGYEYEVNPADATVTVHLDAVICPECGSEDVKEGACPDPTRPTQTADYGCRDCGELWNDE